MADEHYICLFDQHYLGAQDLGVHGIQTVLSQHKEDFSNNPFLGKTCTQRFSECLAALRAHEFNEVHLTGLSFTPEGKCVVGFHSSRSLNLGPLLPNGITGVGCVWFGDEHALNLNFGIRQHLHSLSLDLTTYSLMRRVLLGLGIEHYQIVCASGLQHTLSDPLFEQRWEVQHALLMDKGILQSLLDLKSMGVSSGEVSRCYGSWVRSGFYQDMKSYLESCLDPLEGALFKNNVVSTVEFQGHLMSNCFRLDFDTMATVVATHPALAVDVPKRFECVWTESNYPICQHSPDLRGRPRSRCLFVESGAPRGARDLMDALAHVPRAGSLSSDSPYSPYRSDAGVQRSSSMDSLPIGNQTINMRSPSPVGDVPAHLESKTVSWTPTGMQFQELHYKPEPPMRYYNWREAKDLSLHDFLDFIPEMRTRIAMREQFRRVECFLSSGSPLGLTLTPSAAVVVSLSLTYSENRPGVGGKEVNGFSACVLQFRQCPNNYGLHRLFLYKSEEQWLIRSIQLMQFAVDYLLGLGITRVHFLCSCLTGYQLLQHDPDQPGSLAWMCGTMGAPITPKENYMHKVILLFNTLDRLEISSSPVLNEDQSKDMDLLANCGLALLDHTGKLEPLLTDSSILLVHLDEHHSPVIKDAGDMARLSLVRESSIITLLVKGFSAPNLLDKQLAVLPVFKGEEITQDLYFHQKRKGKALLLLGDLVRRCRAPSDLPGSPRIPDELPGWLDSVRHPFGIIKQN